jgi:hypothetical protein
MQSEERAALFVFNSKNRPITVDNNQPKLTWKTILVIHNPGQHKKPPVFSMSPGCYLPSPTSLQHNRSRKNPLETSGKAG